MRTSTSTRHAALRGGADELRGRAHLVEQARLAFEAERRSQHRGWASDSEQITPIFREIPPRFLTLDTWTAATCGPDAEGELLGWRSLLFPIPLSVASLLGAVLPAWAQAAGSP